MEFFKIFLPPLTDGRLFALKFKLSCQDFQISLHNRETNDIFSELFSYRIESPQPIAKDWYFSWE